MQLKPFEHTVPLKLTRSNKWFVPVPEKQVAPLIDGCVWPSKTPVNVKSFKDKVVFVTVTQTWCPSCRAEWPNLIDLYEEYKTNKSFRMVAIVVDDGLLEEPTNDWLKANPAGFTIVIARTSKKVKYPSVFADIWGVNAYPANYLVDKTGLVRFSNVYGNSTKQHLDKLLGITK